MAGQTKNPIIIQFSKMELSGDWDTSWSNPEGAVTFDNGKNTNSENNPEKTVIKITLQNGTEEKYPIDPKKHIRVFRDVVHFTKKE
jgi:hypothetical protein